MTGRAIDPTLPLLKLFEFENKLLEKGLGPR